MTMFYAFVALCLTGSALAQVPGIGHCPKVHSQEDFKVSGILGRWYEYARFFHSFELKAKCNVVEYTHGKNSTLYVKNSYISGIGGSPGYVDADVHVPYEDYQSKMKIKGLPLSHFDVESDYYILGTDYKSFAVVYACTDYDYVNTKFAWILTRKQVPDASVVEKAHEVVRKNNINVKRFWKTEQKNCWDKPADKFSE